MENHLYEHDIAIYELHLVVPHRLYPREIE
jgi:hypothetical protein